MSDAYAAAGVDTDHADEGVGALVSVLRTIETGSPSRSLVPSGHYASVLRVTDDLGIAIATDGVGSKLVVAEQADRLETVGIDCVAMNVNDLICVGAEPIALVDYLAVEEVDAARLARIGVGLKMGAEAAGCEIPGGELAVLPELIRGHPSPQGFDLCATAIGTVKVKDIILGDRIAPGDALIGVPSSGLHSNGYTLARRALLDTGPTHPGLSLDDRPAELGGASVADALLEPTVIYVRAVLDLLRSDVDVRGLSHITGGGLNNLLRVGSGYAIEDPLPVPAVFGLVARLGDVSEAEMWEVFNMGCGLVAIVPDEQADAAAEILSSHHAGARRIGSTTDTGTVTVPSLGLSFPTR
ncbi:MAG TPA: phosphoribosylformylglycinamidine cyclo-ligase [Baekduia sp.]|jgi:phosphoribosylformylglycinamidine cyclo-ligase|nr:phosphoribosylformylglycinamidine cyclo-ligase [Baekduia sp.]